MTTPDFFTPDAELKAENLELKQSVENLRAEVNRLSNVIAERDTQIDNLKAEIEAHVNINHDNAESAAEYDREIHRAESRGYRLALEAVMHYAKDGIIQNNCEPLRNSKSQEGQA